MTRNQPCGLIRSNSLTVPAIDSVWLRSNMAKEWWAPAAVAKASMEVVKQLISGKRFMIEVLVCTQNRDDSSVEDSPIKRVRICTRQQIQIVTNFNVCN